MGEPEEISTSYVERQNLTLRMQYRRLPRLKDALSNGNEQHIAALALYVAHYNFCRVHEALRCTPAMAQKISFHIWSIGELVAKCLELAPDEPRKNPPKPFGLRVIQ